MKEDSRSSPELAIVGILHMPGLGQDYHRGVAC